MHKLVVTQQLVVLVAAAAVLVSQLSAADQAGRIGLPNCPTSCGDVAVPYPFGIIPGCYLRGFNLTCDRRQHPPRLLVGDGTLQVVSISLLDATLRVQTTAINISFDASTSDGGGTWDRGLGDAGPYILTDGFNEFVVAGCNIQATVLGNSSDIISGCASFCSMKMNWRTFLLWKTASGARCTGIVCCQAPIPICRASYDVRLRWLDPKHEFDGQAPVSVLIAEAGWFRQINSLAELEAAKASTAVPLILEWAIRSDELQGLNEAQDGNATCPKDLGSSACHSRFSSCQAVTHQYTNHTGRRYTCRCWGGYDGNPYLPDGCQDIDECALTGSCYGTCTNIPGGYLCRCPRGTHGNDPYSPNGCTKSSTGLSIGIGVGSGAGLLFLILGATFLTRKVKAQKRERSRQRFFKQNRGQLLQHLVSQRADIAERMIITLEEIEKATNNFDRARELGGGRHGIVYKGILSSLHVVAIKKSKIIIQREIDEFINEVAILSQINHRNIVKLLGCCLETEVPLLVYEFISNGALYSHLHVKDPVSLPWNVRLRIAVETARALAYLHSFVSVPIVHRDIKSPNILLDDNLTVKLSDFGASRYIPIDQTGVDTVVQGTSGYLDPMYYSTGLLSEKSDVYSFGVILIELLTRKMPLYYRSPQGYGLARHFVNLLSEGNLVHILDPQVVEEGDGEVDDAALLAAICVKSREEDRPTMRQVEMTLETIQASKEHVVSDVTDDRSEGSCIWANDLYVEGIDMEATSWD